MKTELIVGKLSIHFESQARRRLFVTLFYIAVAVICLAWCSFNPKETIGAWILSGGMILGTALAIVFTIGGTFSDARNTSTKSIPAPVCSRAAACAAFRSG